MTFNAYKWQKRRKLEKIEEIRLRDQKLSQQPQEIKSVNELNWLNKTDEEFSEKYAYRPYKLKGKFDHSKEVLIQRTRDGIFFSFKTCFLGEPGFIVVTPFYCYKDQNNKDYPLLVDRGWIPHDFANQNEHKVNAKGQLLINGILYRGDKANQYTKETIQDKRFVTINPEELSNYLELPNKEIAKQALIKQIEFENVNKTNLPRVISKEDLMNWTITPEKHQAYYRFWMTATILNVLSNIYVWVFI